MYSLGVVAYEIIARLLVQDVVGDDFNVGHTCRAFS